MGSVDVRDAEFDDVLADVRRPGVGEQCADPGVRAVGADQQVVRRVAAVGEAQHTGVGGLERAPQRTVCSGEGVQQQVPQIGTVHLGAFERGPSGVSSCNSRVPSGSRSRMS